MINKDLVRRCVDEMLDAQNLECTDQQFASVLQAADIEPGWTVERVAQEVTEWIIRQHPVVDWKYN